MKEYNVTILMPSALRNDLECRALASKPVWTREEQIQSDFDGKKVSKTSIHDESGVYSLINVWNRESDDECVRLNVTLVYQGHIVAKFAILTGASEVMLHA